MVKDLSNVKQDNCNFSARKVGKISEENDNLNRCVKYFFYFYNHKILGDQLVVNCPIAASENLLQPLENN